jgi:hypothetical protein
MPGRAEGGAVEHRPLGAPLSVGATPETRAGPTLWLVGDSPDGAGRPSWPFDAPPLGDVPPEGCTHPDCDCLDVCGDAGPKAAPARTMDWPAVTLIALILATAAACLWLGATWGK